jgi:transketolase
MDFEAIRRQARRRLLQMHYESKVGHIGGNLSALDILLFLYHHHMQREDIFVLSKGHSAGALYITLWSKGLLQDGELSTFHRDGTRLCGHPPAQGLPQVPFATGSLGHGLPLAAGLAMGYRLQKDARRVFCLLSDGEIQEGSNWEALWFSCHHALSNLVLLVDGNGFQGFGSTKEVSGQGASSFAAMCASQGMPCAVIDGHDPQALAEALNAPLPQGALRIIWCNTVKGKGVSFMENRMDSHYLPLTEEQYSAARAALEQEAP